MTSANDQTGKVLREQWPAFLDDIADLELQRRTWLDPANRNPHWSYIEFVCSYPDADQLKDGRNKGWLSPAEAEILLEFRQVLVAHKAPTGNAFDNEAVLNDPAWHDVVRAAQLAQQAIASLAQISCR
jgi:hypothetical protein